MEAEKLKELEKVIGRNIEELNTTTVMDEYGSLMYEEVDEDVIKMFEEFVDKKNIRKQLHSLHFVKMKSYSMRFYAMITIIYF